MFRKPMLAVCLLLSCAGGLWAKEPPTSTQEVRGTVRKVDQDRCTIGIRYDRGDGFETGERFVRITPRVTLVDGAWRPFTFSNLEVNMRVKLYIETYRSKQVIRTVQVLGRE